MLITCLSSRRSYEMQQIAVQQPSASAIEKSARSTFALNLKIWNKFCGSLLQSSTGHHVTQAVIIRKRARVRYRPTNRINDQQLTSSIKTGPLPPPQQIWRVSGKMPVRSHFPWFSLSIVVYETGRTSTLAAQRALEYQNADAFDGNKPPVP